MKTTILIVDDELDIQSSLSFALKDEGYEVLTASSPKEALKILSSTRVHVGLFDVWFPEGDGIELLQQVREMAPNSSIIMMSGHGNIELALKAIRLGAFDFLEKPLELEKVLVVLNNAAEISRLKIENSDLQSKMLEDFAVSPTLVQLAEKIEKSFRRPKSVTLLLGQAGVGKHSLCRWMHSRLLDSSRFVSVHCGSLTESNWKSEFEGAAGKIGYLADAAGGVLYLSNIERAPAGLLRFLSAFPIDDLLNRGGGSRIVFSSALSQKEWQEKINLGEAFQRQVLNNSFEIPSLKDLQGEFPQICSFMISSIAKASSLPAPKCSPEFVAALASSSWIGNGRELRNLLERVMSLRDLERAHKDLELRDLPDDLPMPASTLGARLPVHQLIENADSSLRELRSQFERELLSRRLQHFGGNITKAAESLGIERSHLHRKIKAYEISGAAE